MGLRHAKIMGSTMGTMGFTMGIGSTMGMRSTMGIGSTIGIGSKGKKAS